MANFVDNDDFSETRVGNSDILTSYLKSNAKNINFAHINTCSINPRKNSGKIDFFKSIHNFDKLDVLGISETWTKSYITNKSIAINGFNIVRNDRIGKRGGGVALYINSNLKFNVVASSNKTDIEYLFVEILLNSEKYIVGVIYRPRGYLNCLDNVIADLCSKYKNIIIMGDFNYNLLENSKLDLMKSYWENYGLEIMCNGNKPTHYDAQYISVSLLDCFFKNISSNIIN